jgi:hypothetical protein
MFCICALNITFVAVHRSRRHTKKQAGPGSLRGPFRAKRQTRGMDVRNRRVPKCRIACGLGSGPAVRCRASRPGDVGQRISNEGVTVIAPRPKDDRHAPRVKSDRVKQTQHTSQAINAPRTTSIRLAPTARPRCLRRRAGRTNAHLVVMGPHLAWQPSAQQRGTASQHNTRSCVTKLVRLSTQPRPSSKFTIQEVR